MQKIITWLLLSIVYLISKLPMFMIRIFGIVLGTLGYYIVSGRRKVGLINLNLCFPQMSASEKRKIIRSHFQYLVTAVFEYGLVFYASRKRIQQIVRMKNVENLTRYYGNKPVILLCPHFVGLDLGAIRISTEFPGVSMYSQQKNSVVADKLKEARMRFMKDRGGKIFSRKEGLRPIIRKLRQDKQLFYYLPDQDFGERDSLFVPFFAHPYCATVNVLPKLVEMMDAVVVPVTVHRDGNQYEVEFYPSWDDYPTDNLEVDVIRMNKFIEEAVLKALPQYFWLHKRFKTQPNVERGSIYTQRI